jgi:hypothetical protein
VTLLLLVVVVVVVLLLLLLALQDGHIRVGKLNLVDLAGSERQSKTGATGVWGWGHAATAGNKTLQLVTCCMCSQQTQPNPIAITCKGLSSVGQI